MTLSSSNALDSDRYRVSTDGCVPLTLSFTRFVAAHGGSNSLRHVDRLRAALPQHAVEARSALTFTGCVAAVRQIGPASAREW